MPVARLTFHGELQDFLPHTRRGKELVQTFFGTAAVKDVVESAGVPHVEIDWLVVDGLGVPLAHRLSRDCSVQVYPVNLPPPNPTGTRVGVPPPDPRRFVADVHLGRLAFDLRMLGFDTLWKNDSQDAELAKLASKEDRILLTRDVGLLKRGEVKYGYWPRASGPWQQLGEVVERFGLTERSKPFSRCMKCNGTLQAVRKAEVEAQLPPKVRAAQQEFLRCSSCAQVYWKGTHHQKMEARVATLPRGPAR